MLTWWWIGTTRNCLSCPVVPDPSVAIMWKGCFCDHSCSHPPPVLCSWRCQVRNARLGVGMVMAHRVHCMMMPRRCVGGIVAPTLGEALMTRHCGVRGAGYSGGRASGWRGCGSDSSCRVVGLVVGGGAGTRSGCCRWPKTEGRAALPVVPGGAGSGSRVRCQIVVGRRISASVRLVMI